ncbi:MAG TPA: hypothetical protein VIY26_08150 [Acidimicrobiales bacterium]
MVVRYTVKPESLDENVRLVRAVYDELAATQPEGLRYSTCRVDDLTFVHIAVLEGAVNPLDDTAAFRTFAEGIAQRCDEGPLVMGGELVGMFHTADTDGAAERGRHDEMGIAMNTTERKQRHGA